MFLKKTAGFRLFFSAAVLGMKDFSWGFVLDWTVQGWMAISDEHWL